MAGGDGAAAARGVALLRDDGSLWVHCDDAEQASLRVLLDDALGREAFVATIVWQRRYSRENRRAFSTAHDYLHVYAPAGAEFKHHRNRLPRNDPPGTWRDDGDPRGPWSTVSLVAQGGHATRAQFYAIALPSGRVVEPPPGSCWRVTRERYEALAAAGLVWCGAGGDNVPRRKVFLADAQGLVPSTWWTHAEAGHNAEASAEQRRPVPGRAPVLDAEARAADGADRRDRDRSRATSCSTRSSARRRPRRSRTSSGAAWIGIEASARDDRALRRAAAARGGGRQRPRRDLRAGGLGGRRRLRSLRVLRRRRRLVERLERVGALLEVDQRGPPDAVDDRPLLALGRDLVHADRDPAAAARLELEAGGRLGRVELGVRAGLLVLPAPSARSRSRCRRS